MTFDLAFFAAMVPAVILMGLAKGGFAGLGLLSLPLMALVVTPLQAAAIMLPLLIAQDVVTVWSYRREADPFNILTLMPGALLGTVAAYILASRVSDAAVSLALGIICAGFALRRLLESGKAEGPVRKAIFSAAPSGAPSRASPAPSPMRAARPSRSTPCRSGCRPPSSSARAPCSSPS